MKKKKLNKQTPPASQCTEETVYYVPPLCICQCKNTVRNSKKAFRFTGLTSQILDLHLKSDGRRAQIRTLHGMGLYWKPPDRWNPNKRDMSDHSSPIQKRTDNYNDSIVFPLSGPLLRPVRTPTSLDNVSDIQTHCRRLDTVEVHLLKSSSETSILHPQMSLS